MGSLVKTNRHIRNRRRRDEMFESDARNSSIFEGARGLPGKKNHTGRRKRRSIAIRKKSASKS